MENPELEAISKIHVTARMAKKSHNIIKERKFLLRIRYVIPVILGIAIYFGHRYIAINSKYRFIGNLWIEQKPLIIYKEDTKPRLELRSSFADDPATWKHQKYSTLMDPCRILQQCFKGSKVFGTYDACHRNLERVMRFYNSGFMVEVAEGKEDRLVGFLSVSHDVAYKLKYQEKRRQSKLSSQHDDYHSLIIYNVCIDEERRGQGIAKRMIPQYIQELIKHYELEKYASATGNTIDPITLKPIPPLLIGLDVDLTSESMADAFSLYVKLGFVRWWTPCSSVTNHKWTSLIDFQLNYNTHDQGYHQDEKKDAHSNVMKAEGLLPTRFADFPLACLLWNPAPYLKNSFNFGKSRSLGKRPNHFCMYKFQADSFHEMAKSLLFDPHSKSNFVPPPLDGSPVVEDDPTVKMP